MQREKVSIQSLHEMKERGEKIWDKHATTLWLASEVSKPKTKEHLRPFGWAVLREMTQVFTELGLADKRKVQEAASRVADEVIRRMPDVLEEAAAQEAVDGS